MPEVDPGDWIKTVERLPFKAQSVQSMPERLAGDYAELADDLWLPLENEALVGVEKDRRSPPLPASLDLAGALGESE
jgi:hypothetical protein